MWLRQCVTSTATELSCKTQFQQTDPGAISDFRCQQCPVTFEASQFSKRIQVISLSEFCSWLVIGCVISTRYTELLPPVFRPHPTLYVSLK